MTIENEFRGTFILLTKPLDPWPVENIADTGTPDVWLSTGGVELKTKREWPVRERTQFKLDHYTQVQRGRLLARWVAGGGAWLCLKVRENWFIFDGPAAQRVGFLTRAELIATATHYFPKKPDSASLCACFQRKP